MSQPPLPPSRPVSALLFLLLLPVASPPASADGRWAVTVAQQLGSPSGWIEVRENELAGTRLRLADDLGIHRSVSTRAELRRRTAGGGAWIFRLAGTSLSGATTAAPGWLFNGTQIEPGSRLASRTSYSDFLQARVAYEHPFVARSAWRLSGWAGLEYTALDFRLDGTIAPSSVGHELKEDFVTQELPVPLAGLAVEAPLAGRFGLGARLELGGLPRIDSLRNEGGTVRLEQVQGDASLDVAWRLAAGRRLGLCWEQVVFDQTETSREDGNRIRLRDRRLGLSFAWTF